ncbi:conjugative relaxase domain-containing protein, TrwC/TraI family, partial [Prauserella aidingensis]|uniref:MobF family relaxase n=1 Tax=Prauserella aidingensis TaxID=387890 RepID=UPI0020A547A9
MLDVTRMPLSTAAREYLLDAVGCTVERDEAQLAAERGDVTGYYTAASDKGENPGRLAGGKRALQALGLKAGQCSRGAAEALLSCLHPQTGEPLGQRPAQGMTRDERLRQAFREAGEVDEEEARRIVRQVDKDSGRVGAAFFDFTFSAPKSVSVMHAACDVAGRSEWAGALMRAHQDAVAFAQEYAMSQMTTRTYADGSKRPTFASVADGVVRLDFDHQTSRAQDPHLHTHSAVIGKTLPADGAWRSVYSQGVHSFKAAVDAAYEAKLSELIEQDTPFRTQTRDDGVTFEIVGVPAEVIAESSTRTNQVLTEVARARQEFIAEYGREPSESEQREIHDKAGKMTRAAKTDAAPG